VCSDGLTSEVPDARILEVLRGTPDPQKAADMLVDGRGRRGPAERTCRT